MLPQLDGLCVLQGMLLPEPTYKGPESIVYFRGNTLQEELKKDTKVSGGCSVTSSSPTQKYLSEASLIVPDFYNYCVRQFM